MPLSTRRPKPNMTIRPNSIINNPPSVHWDPPHSSSSSSFLVNLDKQPHESLRSPDFSVPDLYELILALHRDCGLEPFFNNLIGILSTHFGAQRVSIALPNDETDIVNIPWGLKALWNKDKPPPLEPQFSNQQPSATTNNVSKKNSEVTTPTERDLSDDSWDTDFEDDDTYSALSAPTTPRPNLSRTESFKRKFSLSRKLSTTSRKKQSPKTSADTGKLFITSCKVRPIVPRFAEDQNYYDRLSSFSSKRSQKRCSVYPNSTRPIQETYSEGTILF